MIWVVVAAIALAEVAAWRLVATGRGSVWRLMIAVFALHAGVAVTVGGFSGPGDRGPWFAAGLGLATGLVLYGATRGFVAIAVGWSPFRRHVQERYRAAREVPLATALVLSIGVAVTGEELFWRGLVQARLTDATSPVAGTVLTWAAYVAANIASSSLPIAAGAVVGGAVWGGLAWLTGGVLASLACHAVWTGLMLSFPPAAGRWMMPA